jgi:hypothetical protein
MRTHSSSLRRVLLGAAGTAMAALLVGCGGGSGSSSGQAVADAGGPVASSGKVGGREAPAPSDSRALAGPGTTVRQGVNRPVVQTRAVISTGRVTLVTRDLTRARDDIDRLLGRYGGYVSREQTTTARAGRPQRATLQLRLPARSFDTVMDSFDDFARVTSTHRASEDVTTQVIDVEARLTTQRDSIRKLRAFLRRTTDVDSMIRLESEISTREADLESLQAQQRYLDDQTAMATIDVSMTQPRTHPATAPPKQDAGFLAGLHNGWTALTAVVAAALTVVGALLPFLVVAALLGIPVWLLVRRLARRRTATVAPGES